MHGEKRYTSLLRWLLGRAPREPERPIDASRLTQLEDDLRAALSTQVPAQARERGWWAVQAEARRIAWAQEQPAPELQQTGRTARRSRGVPVFRRLAAAGAFAAFAALLTGAALSFAGSNDSAEVAEQPADPQRQVTAPAPSTISSSTGSSGIGSSSTDTSPTTIDDVPDPTKASGADQPGDATPATESAPATSGSPATSGTTASPGTSGGTTEEPSAPSAPSTTGPTNPPSTQAPATQPPTTQPPMLTAEERESSARSAASALGRRLVAGDAAGAAALVTGQATSGLTQALGVLSDPQSSGVVSVDAGSDPAGSAQAVLAVMDRVASGQDEWVEVERRFLLVIDISDGGAVIEGLYAMSASDSGSS